MKRKEHTATKKRVTKTPLIVKTSLVIIVFFVLFATVFKITEIILTHKSDNFPKLEISLKNAPIEEIDAGTKEIKYSGNSVTITIDDQTTTYPNVEIKGRGNATWAKLKKPYQIKFSNKEDPFNLGEHKKWVFLANYSDPTHLRNDTAFYLQQLLQETYPLKGTFIDLYFDNSYHGLYYLTPKIDINNSSVNLEDPLGILIELDNLYGSTEGCYYSVNKDCLVIKALSNKGNEDLSIKNFINSFNSLLSAISNQEYTKIAELIDLDSFARYYLLNEFAINPDAYSSSFFLYKNGDHDKIHAGPGWDFDAALGNKDWIVDGMDEKLIHSPTETMPFKNYLGKSTDIPYSKSISTILYDLMDIPEFSEKVNEVYQKTLSGHKEELLNYIKSQADYIRDATLRDQTRWKLQYDFDEEVDYLIDWVAKRYEHFEEVYGAKTEAQTDLNEEAESEI